MTDTQTPKTNPMPGAPQKSGMQENKKPEIMPETKSRKDNDTTTGSSSGAR